MEHPAGVESKRLFFGIECEGKLSGTPSAFVREQLTADEEARLFSAVRSGAVKQVFLTETFFEWRWMEDVLLPLCEEHAVLVTIGRHASTVYELLKRPSASRVRLMVRFLDFPCIGQLRPGDEITVGSPYDLVTFDLLSGVRTVPADYLNDTGQA